MHITVIGTGYVGLVSAVCFSKIGHTVVGVDIDESKIEKLSSGTCTIFEPGLEELLTQELASGRLTFTTDLTQALPETDVIFSAVATPPNEDFSADLKAVFIVAETVAKHVNKPVVFVNKSTVPVGTGKKCEDRIAGILQERGVDFSIPVVSNPEFLREGSAVGDTLEPDRVVIGGESSAVSAVASIYTPLTENGAQLLTMNRESAEIVKYASNAFLASKISFANMLTELCEKTGANITDIAHGMGTDARIGPQFLRSGIGYGGSCFPKDVKALIALSRETGVPFPLVDATHEVNEYQRKRLIEKLLSLLPQNAKVAVWGLSFKPNTDDMREAPSLDVIPALIDAGHTVTCCDPIAWTHAQGMLPDGVEHQDDPLSCAKGADALVVLTEWDLFTSIDANSMKDALAGNVIYDMRNCLDGETLSENGFMYTGVGI